jgi:hypothetical protein
MNRGTLKHPKSSKRRKDRVLVKAQQKNKDVIWQLMCWLIITERLFQEIELHGNIKWKAEEVAVQALIWSWLEAKNVTDAFDESVEICAGLGMKDMAKTYNSFMNALTRYREMFSEVMRDQFQCLAPKACGRFFRNDDWVLIGFDGSRVTAPRTVSNEKAFCAPNYGKGHRAKYGKKLSKGMRRKRNEKNKPQSQAPQAWVTLMWHMGLRLPWTWRLGPSNSVERDHVKEMLAEEELPKNTLFCGDAGFIGYPIWNAILSSGNDFLIRVGGNVKLLKQHADVKPLRDGIVLCWPQQRMTSGDPPLRLRLVSVQVGKTKMWMLTSVLDPKKLGKKQIVRFYKMRWGIEVEFRGLKQTLGNRKLRCRNSDRLLVELDWSIRSMAIAELLATREQIKATRRQTPKKPKDKYDPKDRSLANTIRALRRSLKQLERKTEINEDLLKKLSQARVQRYNNKTNKRARYRPKNPHKKPLGEPEVRTLTSQEREKLKIYNQKIAA